MAFGKGEEVKSFEKKFYTGVENFNVTSVNPSKADIEALIGQEITWTPEYVSTTTVSDSDGERDVPQVRIDFMLTNDGETSIRPKAQFYVANTYHKSQTGKIRAINAYGQDAWLPEENIKSGVAPDSMSWYDMTGVKPAKKGEVELISFIKNLLNIPFNNAKLVNKKDALASIDHAEWSKIFAGDFEPIREKVMSTNNKIGLLLGVKTSADNKVSQVVFAKSSLRQYTLHSTKDDKFKYLHKDLVETQAAGGQGRVQYGPEDFFLREWKNEPTQLSLDNMPDEEDAFAGNVNQGVDEDLDF